MTAQTQVARSAVALISWRVGRRLGSSVVRAGVVKIQFQAARAAGRGGTP